MTTIASFCHDQLMASGPLTLDELADRAVQAGVTRAKNPRASVFQAVRYRQIELLDGRWVAPLQLLEGRCLTTADNPHTTDLDLGLLDIPDIATLLDELDPGQVHCLRVDNNTVTLTAIPYPRLADEHLLSRLAALKQPRERYWGDQDRSALRVVAQLLADDPALLRTPLPPLTDWVPALKALAEQEQRAQEQQYLTWNNRIVLDDCQQIEVELAAERAGVPTRDWVADALDRALAAEHHERPGTVISLNTWRG